MTHDQLRKAVQEIEDGLVDAELGNGLIKKRVSRKGQGKRASYRTLLAFKSKERSIFMFGFAKNERANLDHDEEVLYKKLSDIYLRVPISELENMCANNLLFEVSYEEK